MRESRYNTIVRFKERPELFIAFNARTTATALVEEEKVALISKIVAGETEGIDPSFIADLVKGGFITEDNFDEVKYLKFMRTLRHANKGAIATITTTLECNFCCPYCCQGLEHEGSKMSAEVQDKIFDYIQEQNPTHVGITWYGGEPLMALDVIERLAPKLIEYCDVKKIPYTSDMMTNGYLLTEEMCKKLKELKITRMQISLDGSEKFHDKSRILTSGEPTYQQIMDNLSIACEYFGIALRINITRDNYDTAKEVVEDLIERNLLEKTNPYLGFVCNVSGEFDNDECLTQSEFARIDNEFQKYLYYVTNDKSHTPRGRYPEAILSRCGVEITNTVIIAPDGELFKCLNHLGRKEYSVGNVLTGLTMNNTFLDYTNPDDNFDNKVCGTCKILPLCYGGCIDRAVKKGGGFCIPLKYRLNDYLQEVASQLYEQSTVKL